MLSRAKFIKLKEITRYFRIADELQRLRDCLLNRKTFDQNILEKYCLYLRDFNGQLFIEELSDVLNEKKIRIKAEKAHFLYHKIKDHFGFPVPASKFIKSSNDSEQPRSEKTELVIILENLRSAHNVGSIIRSCECFGVKKLMLTGITPGPEKPGVIKTAMGSEKKVMISVTEKTADAVKDLKESGYMIIAAETGYGSKDIENYSFVPKTAIIFGNEEIGICSDTLKLCDDFLSIAMRGTKNSLNVSNCASVFIYEYVRKCGVAMTVS